MHATKRYVLPKESATSRALGSEPHEHPRRMAHFFYAAEPPTLELWIGIGVGVIRVL